jgi:RNA polymerase sigma-70 factor (TIGR02943 family)
VNGSSDTIAATVKEWVNLYSDTLYSWAYYKTSSKETSEDLVQDTFMAAHQNYSRFESKSNPKTWLLSILKNKIADHFRIKYRSQEKEAEPLDRFFNENGDWVLAERPRNWDATEEELLNNKHFNKTLSGCLEKLPAHWRASITLKFLEERKSAEICQELSISTTNFWQIIHRAKLQLRKCLELNWFNV